MIAKAIVDILSPSPAAPRSAAQGTGQPLQGFCESLLAASKSFSENNVTGDNGSKAGRRQRSDSGDANTPGVDSADAAPDRAAALSPAASQQTQETNASVLLQGTSLVGLTSGDGGSTNTAGLFAQSLTAAGSVGTGSSAVLTDTGSTSIVLPTGIQSSFTAASMLSGKMATARNTARDSDVPTTRNLRSAGLAKKQTSVAQSSNAQADIFQPVAVQSNIIPVQVPISEPAAPQKTGSDVASQPTETVLAMGLAKAELNVASQSNAPANISQSATVQSSFIPVPVAADESGATQSTSNSLTGKTTESARMTGLSETQSSVAQASNIAANSSQPDVVQSNITPAQMALAGQTTAQTASKAVTSQSIWNVASAELPEIQTSIAAAINAPATISQHAVVQSNSIPVQSALAGSARTQNNSHTVASQPTWNVTAAAIPETQTDAAPAINAPAKFSQSAVVESNSISAQMPLTGPATTLNTTAADANQSAQNARSTTPVETQSKISNAKTSQTSISQIADLPKSGNADLSTTLPATSDAAPATDNSGVQDSRSPVAVNASSNAVQNTVANEPTAQSPAFVARAASIASMKDAVAPALKSDSPVQPNPQPATHDQSPATATMSVPAGIAEQLASLPLFDRSIGTIQTIVSNLKPVSASKAQANTLTVDKGSSSAQTGTKKSAEPATVAEEKTDSQDAASSGNQGQGGDATQTQAMAPAPVAVHAAAVAAVAQNTSTVSPNHTSSAPAGTTGVAAKTSGNAAHISTALPQALPVINTAKLIQSMGQSVMRVGMRSNEFGNISISTSAGKDMVSAQISLEHGELAKTLAAHLPEMQARLGGNQPMDVHIDMNGAATGQGTGTFGGTSHGSQDQSRSDRQPAGNMVASYSDKSVAERQFSPVAAAMPTGYARLDIRV